MRDVSGYAWLPCGLRASRPLGSRLKQQSRVQLTEPEQSSKSNAYRFASGLGISALCGPHRNHDLAKVKTGALPIAMVGNGYSHEP
jgi:hypothetical protein